MELIGEPETMDIFSKALFYKLCTRGNQDSYLLSTFVHPKLSHSMCPCEDKANKNEFSAIFEQKFITGSCGVRI
jgi:hypothetical protein